MKEEPVLNGPALRWVTALFAVFVLLQFGTGAVLYVVKIGIHPAQALEYYAGSEAMRVIYPERPDRFGRPRSMEGLVKFSVGHIAAFALIAFLCGHLLRSLTPRAHRRPIEWLAVSLFATATLDVAACFLVAFGPPWTRFVRPGAFLAFEACGTAAGLLLLSRALRARNKPWE